MPPPNRHHQQRLHYNNHPTTPPFSNNAQTTTPPRKHRLARHSSSSRSASPRISACGLLIGAGAGVFSCGTNPGVQEGQMTGVPECFLREFISRFEFSQSSSLSSSVQFEFFELISRFLVRRRCFLRVGLAHPRPGPCCRQRRASLLQVPG